MGIIPEVLFGYLNSIVGGGGRLESCDKVPSVSFGHAPVLT